MVHEGHIVNESSILTHARIESDLTEDEKNQLDTFGKMGSTALNAKNELIRLFLNRTYDSTLIVVRSQKPNPMSVPELHL